MARQIQFLASVAFAATLLTACSNQKFAFRKKIPVTAQETVVSREEKKIKPAEPVAVHEEAPVTAEASAAAPATPEPSASFREKEDALHRAPSVSSGSPIHKKAAEKLSPRQVRKFLKEQSDTDRVSSSINPRQFIIIGLIILLIGVVLSIVLSGLGYLVAVVGVVFIIIGLIVLLANNL